jgi:hypothetical protein
MSLSLPYHFDTTKQNRLIAIVLLIDIIVLPAILLFALWDTMQHDKVMRMVVPMAALIAAVLPVIAVVTIYKSLSPATGSIDRFSIVIRPDRFMGLPNSAPDGSFVPTQFSGYTLVQMKRRMALRLQGPEPGRSVIIANGNRAALQPIADLLEQIGIRKAQE